LFTWAACWAMTFAICIWAWAAFFTIDIEAACCRRACYLGGCDLADFHIIDPPVHVIGNRQWNWRNPFICKDWLSGVLETKFHLKAQKSRCVKH